MPANPNTSTASIARRATKKVADKTRTKTAKTKIEVTVVKTTKTDTLTGEEVAADDEDEDAVEALGKELRKSSTPSASSRSKRIARKSSCDTRSASTAAT